MGSVTDPSEWPRDRAALGPLTSAGSARRAHAKVAELAARPLAHLRFERGLGLDTAGRIRLEDLGAAGEGRENYSPVTWGALRRALPNRALGPGESFLDLGSGKGRMVLLAARHPLRRVVGVEISPELAEISRANLRRAAPHLRCPRVEIVTADTAFYSVPREIGIVHMFNPFRGTVLTATLRRLLDSIDRAPRTVTLIYTNPREHGHDAILATRRARLVRRAHPLTLLGNTLGDMPVRVYEVGPPA